MMGMMRTMTPLPCITFLLDSIAVAPHWAAATAPFPIRMLRSVWIISWFSVGSVGKQILHFSLQFHTHIHTGMWHQLTRKFSVNICADKKAPSTADKVRRREKERARTSVCVCVWVCVRVRAKVRDTHKFQALDRCGHSLSLSLSFSLAVFLSLSQSPFNDKEWKNNLWICDKQTETSRPDSNWRHSWGLRPTHTHAQTHTHTLTHLQFIKAALIWKSRTTWF